MKRKTPKQLTPAAALVLVLDAADALDAASAGSSPRDAVYKAADAAYRAAAAVYTAALNARAAVK